MERMTGTHPMTPTERKTIEELLTPGRRLPMTRDMFEALVYAGADLLEALRESERRLHALYECRLESDKFLVMVEHYEQDAKKARLAKLEEARDA